MNTRKELFGQKKRRSTPFIIYTNFSMDRMRKLSERGKYFSDEEISFSVVMFAVEQMQSPDSRTYYHHNATSLHREYNALNLNSLLESVSFPRMKMKLLTKSFL